MCARHNKVFPRALSIKSTVIDIKLVGITWSGVYSSFPYNMENYTNKWNTHAHSLFSCCIYYDRDIMCTHTKSKLAFTRHFTSYEPVHVFFDLIYSVIAYRHLDILTRLSYKLVKHIVVYKNNININPRAGAFRSMERRHQRH